MLALMLAIGVAALLILPKRYQATAAVLLDVKSPDPISGLMMQGVLAASYTKTQVEVASSEAVGRRAVRDLEVAAVPELGQEWRDATEGRGDFETWAIWKLSKDLDIGTTRESSLLRVSFTSTDPEFAAKAANAWVKAYVDTTLELRVAPARQYREFFTASARQLREALEVAQHRLSSFEQKHGIILSDEKLDMEIGRLDVMNAQLVLQIAQLADSNSRERQGRTGADSTQEALASKLVGDLRADLQRARSRLSELTPKSATTFPRWSS